MGFRREDVRTWFAEAGLKKVVVSSTGERARVPSDSTDNCADISIFMHGARNEASQGSVSLAASGFTADVGLDAHPPCRCGRHPVETQEYRAPS